eukprot:871389-Alexandrium_andersonii.AAC.1
MGLSDVEHVGAHGWVQGHRPVERTRQTVVDPCAERSDEQCQAGRCRDEVITAPVRSGRGPPSR